MPTRDGIKREGAGVVGGGATALFNTTRGVTDIYIDAANGNDLNDGRSPSSAFKTINRLYQTYPQNLLDGARLLVHLAGVGGFGANATAPLTYNTRNIHLLGGGEYNISHVFRGPHMVPATLATGTTTPTMVSYQEVDQSNTPTVGGRRTEITFNAPGWTAGDIQSGPTFLRITRGADLVLFEQTVCENTVDKIYLDVVIPPGVILPTDTYEIVTPGARFEGDAGDFNSSQVTVSGSGGFESVGFEDPAGVGYTFQRIGFKSLRAIGVEGLFFDRCIFEFSATIRGGFAATVLTKSIGFGIIWNSLGKASLPHSRADSSTSPVDTSIVHQLVVVGGPLSIGQPGYASIFGQRGISVYNSYAAGIYCNAAHFDMRTSQFLGGSGNTDVGVHARYGGRIMVPSGLGTQITGTAGDAKAGQSTAVSWGTGVGQFEEVAGLNGILSYGDGSVVIKTY